MEAILNLCANGKTSHKDHVRRAWCAHGLWEKNHKSGHRQEIILAWNETRCKTFHAHFSIKCESTKSIYKKKYGLYKPLSILNKPWENVSMDFMTQLPEWNGMDAIVVVID